MPGWSQNKAALVQDLLTKARDRLVTISVDAPLIEAAKLLQAGADVVIVCNSAGLLAGMITKTDVVAQISQCQGASCVTPSAAVMTRDLVLCQPEDLLHEVWARLKARGLKNVPVVDQMFRPLGILNARDILQTLLRESENEDAMLREYVMDVGYR